VESNRNSTSGSLRIHAWESASRTNGPGLRAVLWVQCCTLNCSGCFNPETHSLNGGEEWTEEVFIAKVQSLPSDVTGITITGGEPLQQISVLANLLTLVRSLTELSIIVFTGYDWYQVQRLSGTKRLIDQLDVLIAGPYLRSQHVGRALIGSANQRMFFFTDRYSPSDFVTVPQTEVILSAAGTISFTGIDPLKWG
jgi:anaerobic ribonucleoside-triphosphate reductase activating protein